MHSLNSDPNIQLTNVLNSKTSMQIQSKYQTKDKLSSLFLGTEEGKGEQQAWRHDILLSEKDFIF